MNSIIVWVLVVYTHGSNYVPTLEFTSEQKCIAAIHQINNDVAAKSSWFDKPASRNSRCVKIEK